ncbi:MAG: Type II restriction enzyme BsuBI [Candidatus Jettenia ecosi]|uniref:Type II restriction enzyme BsuBI n=1 Tax=Candidatus Jettenia ecosi TaxID=2494326 RepID=A0A533QDJ4_9BACT|nr:MAG: Type II restriction enzyme BsuBI [Candidatus Jettenia ecosi]
MNLPIDTAESLPDVILFSGHEKRLVIIEAVISSGPVNPICLEQLQKFTKESSKLGYKISYVTAFPSRAVFRRFVEEIAWGSSVWIENEPNNIVHFEKLDDK